MLTYYLKIAWRHLKRYKSLSLINIIGLTLAISVFLMIALFIYDEWSYDRYHEDAEKLYRVYTEYSYKGQTGESVRTWPILGPTIQEEITGVEAVARISSRYREALIKTEDYQRYDGLLIADPSIFEIFSFSFIRGNPENVLSRPFTVVVTKSTAERYIGDKNPVGKTVTIETNYGTRDFEVTGVLKDIPSNTHFSFNFLTSMATLRKMQPNPEEHFESWGYVGSLTYLELESGYTPKEIEPQLQDLLKRHSKFDARTKDMKLQPVTDIHLYSDFNEELGQNSDIRYIYIFGSIALLILLIAGINYVNLTTARSADRAKEVGIQKTLGVTRPHLIGRFLIESVTIFSIAVLIAFLLTEMFLPFFNNLTGKELSLLAIPPPILVLLVLPVLIFGILSGLYPAVVLSKHQPGNVLYGVFSSKRKSLLRQSLVIFQFVISIILLISTIVMDRQLAYVANQDFGLNVEDIIRVKANFDRHDPYGALKDKLLQYSDVKSVTFSTSNIPNKNMTGMSLSPENYSGPSNSIGIGPRFLKTLEIPLVKGKNIDQLLSNDNIDYMPVIVNKTAVEDFGWSNEALGKTLSGFRPTPKVVGVVENFHYESLKQRIEPLVLMGDISVPRNIYIKSRTGNIGSTLNSIKNVWEQVVPDKPFNYTFLKDDYKNLYQSEDKLASIFTYFTILAIVIACMGLYGLSAFTTQRRTKEIGIRKVVGASTINIVSLLSKDFLKRVGMSLLVAIPASIYIVNQWLQQFAYKIDWGIGVILLSVAITVVITLITVSWHSIKAALANPAESVRIEG